MDLTSAAKIVPQEITAHGDARVDNYFWLGARSDPDTIAYLEAENRYPDAGTAPPKPLQETLYKEILGRIKETDLTVPVKRDDYFYYVRTEEGQAYSIYCRKHRSLEAPEEILLDSNALARGQKYFRLGNFSVSPDHRVLAYSSDLEGEESYTISVQDLATGELLPERIANTYYTLEWANDKRTFFYTVLDPARRPYQVFRHELGGAPDALVYQEDDGRFTLGLNKTRSRRFVFIELSSPLTSEVRYLDAAQPQGEFQVMLARRQGIEYDAAHQGDSFYIRINEDSKTFRLMRTPAANPSRANWEEVIAARAAVTIEGVDCFENLLVVYERERGLEKICVRGVTGSYYVEFPQPPYTLCATGNAEYRTKTIRFSYTSLVTPVAVFDFDMATREPEFKQQYEV